MGLHPFSYSVSLYCECARPGDGGTLPLDPPVSKRVTPRSTAEQITATASFLWVRAEAKLRPMHPKAMAETSRLLFPSLRFGMV